MLPKYFELEESRRIPDIRVLDSEKVNEAECKIAFGLSNWLRNITPEKILENMITMLNRYEEALAKLVDGSDYLCQSDYVKLSANPSNESVAHPIFIIPRRVKAQ
jgi:hypothetical protein